MKENRLITSIIKYTVAQIKLWESEVKITLPSDYKDFLVIYGKSRSDLVLHKAIQLDMEFWPHQWLGFFDKDKELICNHFLHDKEKSFYPFANDQSGAVAYISLQKNNFGSIYISNWNDYDEEKEEYQKFKVADTFQEFIDSLMTEEEAIAKGLL